VGRERRSGSQETGLARKELPPERADGKKAEAFFDVC